jgi:hypothetical protein
VALPSVIVDYSLFASFVNISFFVISAGASSYFQRVLCCCPCMDSRVKTESQLSCVGVYALVHHHIFGLLYVVVPGWRVVWKLTLNCRVWLCVLQCLLRW